MSNIEQRREILAKAKKVVETVRKNLQKPKNIILGTVMAASMNANAMENTENPSETRPSEIENIGGFQLTRMEEGAGMIEAPHGQKILADHMNISAGKDFAAFVAEDSLNFIDRAGNVLNLGKVEGFLLGNQFRGNSETNSFEVYRAIKGDAIDKIFAAKIDGEVQYGFVDSKEASVTLLKKGVKVTEAKYSKDGQLNLMLSTEDGYENSAKNPEQIKKFSAKKYQMKYNHDTLSLGSQMIAGVNKSR